MVDAFSREAVHALVEAATKIADDGPDGGFITGSDYLRDGGVTAAY